MTLEARVDALEQDMAALRAETRMWAAFASSADRKTIAVGELIMHLDQQVNDFTAEAAAMRKEHGQMLREILSRLS
jgi:hypothetical protein